MIGFQLADLVDATGAVLLRGELDRPVHGVSTDTRTLEEGALFVALSGPNFDGNAFAGAAIEQGAAGLMLAGSPTVLGEAAAALPGKTTILCHEDPRRALSDLASWHRSHLEIPVVGITGSCGKTTTKNILVELCSSTRRTVGSPNSFNNDIGVPHTLFLADEETEMLVVEMGTNHPGEIAGLCRTARPTGAIITNIGASHLEGLLTIEGVAHEKSALAACVPNSGFCVLNADCPWTPTLRDLTTAEVITFSVEGDGDLNATDIWFHAGGTTLRLEGREITFGLLGLHNVQNLLAALAACRGLGLEFDAVLPGVSRIAAGTRRLERKEIGDWTVLDDTYNANPDSASASVRVLAGMHGYSRRVLILGDMLELGELAAELHHRIGVEVAESGIDRLVLVGELTRATAAGALEGGLPESSIEHFGSVKDALLGVPALLASGDLILVKGSRRVGLEQLVALFERNASVGSER